MYCLKYGFSVQLDGINEFVRKFLNYFSLEIWIHKVVEIPASAVGATAFDIATA